MASRSTTKGRFNKSMKAFIAGHTKHNKIRCPRYTRSYKRNWIIVTSSSF